MTKRDIQHIYTNSMTEFRFQNIVEEEIREYLILILFH